MVARELVRAEAAAIKRHAAVISIKRQALGLAPPTREVDLRAPRRPRPVFVLAGNSRLQRALLNRICEQRALMYRRSAAARH
jgi:hypothetical protein